MKVNPDAERLENQLEALAAIRNPGLPGFTRRAFTGEYKRGRRWLLDTMQAAGLTVRMDRTANVIGTLRGIEPALAPIMVGSHTDTVLGAGRYDGMLGVLSGVEAARALQAAGIRLRHTLKIVDFLSEEPSEFGISTIGSRGMAGDLSEADLALRDKAGRTLREAIASMLDTAFEGENGPACAPSLYMELHIEQGPVLEQSHCSLGVVTGIVGIRRCRVTLEGVQNHAGTTPMNARHDALAGACALILELESACQKSNGSAVGTVGKLFVEPNASNVIPGRCTFEMDVRSLKTSVMENLLRRFRARAEQLCGGRGLRFTFELISRSNPLEVGAPLQRALEAICKTVASTMRIVSGGGHDGNHIGALAPVVMLFVPSEGGKSHCPEEHTAPSDVAAGLKALTNSILLFDGMMDKTVQK